MILFMGLLKIQTFCVFHSSMETLKSLHHEICFGIERKKGSYPPIPLQNKEQRILFFSWLINHANLRAQDFDFHWNGVVKRRDGKYSVKTADFLIMFQFINDNRFDSEEFV